MFLNNLYIEISLNSKVDILRYYEGNIIFLEIGSIDFCALGFHHHVWFVPNFIGTDKDIGFTSTFKCFDRPEQPAIK